MCLYYSNYTIKCYSSPSDVWNEDTLFKLDTIHGPNYIETCSYKLPLKWGHLLIVKTANVVPQMSAIERFPVCFWSTGYLILLHTHMYTHTHTHTHNPLSATVSIGAHT